MAQNLEVQAVLSKFQGVCQTYFSTRYYEDIVSGDTQYDIESLEHAFKNEYRQAAGANPSPLLFYQLLRKVCRCNPPDSDFED